MESWREGRQKKRNSSEGQEHINWLFHNTEGVPSADECLCWVHHSSAVRRQVNDAFERISYNSDNFDSYCLSGEKPEQCFVSGTKIIWQKKANLEPTTLSKRCTYGHRWFNSFHLLLFPNPICPRTLLMCCQRLFSPLIPFSQLSSHFAKLGRGFQPPKTFPWCFASRCPQLLGLQQRGTSARWPGHL